MVGFTIGQIKSFRAQVVIKSNSAPTMVCGIMVFTPTQSRFRPGAGGWGWKGGGGGGVSHGTMMRVEPQRPKRNSTTLRPNQSVAPADD